MQFVLLAAGSLLRSNSSANAQVYVWEEKHFRMIYFSPAYEYLLPHIARTFENAYEFHRNLFDYESQEKITLLIHDFSDFGEAGADGIPRNRITVSIAPYSYIYETVPANERFNSTMNHEVVHIAAIDRAASRDRFFRKCFFGKVSPDADQPLSMIYSYATAPRRYAPRWYHEGIAAFLETWMAGGLGRALGSYDEMVWRTKVADDTDFHDPLSLESEGVKTDFQVGALSYLYGTRFMSYLAYQYGPDKLMLWITRNENSDGYYASQFLRVYGRSLDVAWDEWVQWEKKFQSAVLDSLRIFPASEDHALASKSLGSVSRSFIDGKNMIIATHSPGEFAFIRSIDRSGTTRKLTQVRGPVLYDVASMTLDTAGNLFYTTDNNEWRDIHQISLRDGSTRRLLKDARIGDLASNRRDRSLWGVRHYNGISSLVRVPVPFEEWNLIFAFPYGQDVYDIDVSPDGEWVSASLAQVNGRHLLIRMRTEVLMNGRLMIDTLFEFEDSTPANFVFSPDGTAMIGTSYYTGVSNIYRYDLTTRTMQIMTNGLTGYFRPVPTSADSVMAFRYSGHGFLPVVLALRPVDSVGAISYLGQAVIDRYPELSKWALPSPARFDFSLHSKSYSGWSNLRIESLYPVVEGYKNKITTGFRLNLSDPTGFHKIHATITASRGPAEERWHGMLKYRYLNWSVFGSTNRSDFYDLFGPTKTGRKGYGVGIEYDRTFVYDGSLSMGIDIRAAGYAGLERLPEYQNVKTDIGRFGTFATSFYHKNVMTSLGGVDAEKGHVWKIGGDAFSAHRQTYPRVSHQFDLAIPLPLRHSSLWVRTSAGTSLAGGSFSRFYFGGFGNNWVDHGEAKRYRTSESFPGRAINAIPARHYFKILPEWTLPPVIFKRAGRLSLYANYMHVTLFSSVLCAREGAAWTFPYNVGTQIDIRLVAMSYLKFTLSTGYAIAFTKGRNDGREWMMSLKIH